MKIFGMGGFEIVIILIVVLLIFGPKNLPKLGKAFGRTVSSLRSGMNEGKKKDGDEASAEGEPADKGADGVKEIEGETALEAQDEAEAQQGPENLDDASENHPDSSDFDGDPADQPEFTAADEDDDSREAAEEQPKKVKRVVRKKTTAE